LNHMLRTGQEELLVDYQNAWWEFAEWTIPRMFFTAVHLGLKYVQPSNIWRSDSHSSQDIDSGQFRWAVHSTSHRFEHCRDGGCSELIALEAGWNLQSPRKKGEYYFSAINFELINVFWRWRGWAADSDGNTVSDWVNSRLIHSRFVKPVWFLPSSFFHRKIHGMSCCKWQAYLVG
jgi:hypothetical protein